MHGLILFVLLMVIGFIVIMFGAGAGESDEEGGESVAKCDECGKETDFATYYGGKYYCKECYEELRKKPKLREVK